MKRIKQSIATLLALVMMMALAVPTALAADETFTITGPGNGKTYYIYQIFTGTVGEDGALTDIVWGQNGTGTAGEAVSGDVLNALSAVAGSTSDVEKLAVINTYVDKGVRFGQIWNDQTLEVPAGYYLIEDISYDADPDRDIVLEIVEDVTINPKDSDIPTVVKKVYEEDSAADYGYGAGYNDVADAEIGERVTFKLVGSIPEDVGAYETYYYAFHDEYDDGLSELAIESVYLASATGAAAGTELTEDEDYTVAEGTGTFTVAFADLNDVLLKDADAQYIIVEFTMTLDADANIGSTEGNPNSVYLEYTTEGGGTGETEKDYVLVFTWTLNGDKTDGNTDEKLADAKFVLLNSAQTHVATIDENRRLVSWVALPKALDEMTVEDWEAVTGTSDGRTGTAVMTSNNNGTFGVVGLDDDTYYLLEIEAPDGYNLLTAPIKAEIRSELNHNGEYYGNNDSEMLIGLYLYIDDAEAPASCVMQGSGVATVPIANFSGTTLPETGGMGTTIFYIVGAALVLGVVVILVARKRMENE